MSRHAFVTGAAGFVGTYLVRELVAAGWSVTGLVRRPQQAEPLGESGAEPVIGDLREASLMLPGLRAETVVFHLAAPMTTWELGIEEGVMATTNLIRLMLDRGVRRLVHVSSASVHTPVHGQRIVDEDLALEPHPGWSQYARQKVAAERVVIRAGLEHNLWTTVVRPSRVLGPGDRRLVSWAQMMATLVRRGPVDIHRRRHPVVVVGELARGLVALAEARETVGQAYYISSTAELTKGDVVDAFLAAGMPPARQSVMRRLALGAGRIAVGALDRSWVSVRPRSRTPGKVLLAAMERRIGLAVAHDCVISSRRAAAHFGWRGTDDVTLAIEQSVRWHQSQYAPSRQDAAAAGVVAGSALL